MDLPIGSELTIALWFLVVGVEIATMGIGAEIALDATDHQRTATPTTE